MTRDETIALFEACEAVRAAARAAAPGEGNSNRDAEEVAQDAAKVHWNAWAEALLAERKAMEADGRWAAENDCAGHLQPNNPETQVWIEKAAVDFSRCRFVRSGIEKIEANGGQEVPAQSVPIAVINFRGFVFPGPADFGNAAFFGHFADFQRAAFCGNVLLRNAAFSGYADFEGAAFSGDAGFQGSAFCHDADFGCAAFSGNANFESAAFSVYANFNSATFSGGALFRGTVFSDEADFESAAFSCYADFEGAAFSGAAYFENATFKSGVCFRGERGVPALRKALVWFVRGVGMLLAVLLLAVGALAGRLYWEVAGSLPDHRLADGTSWHGCVPPGAKHEFVPLSAMPANAINAFLAAEDPEFFSRETFSPLREFANRLRGDRSQRTGSFVSQIYARELFYCLQPDNPPRNWPFRHALLTYRIERDIPRRNILETRINTTYLGRNSYGMAGAAQAYFHKQLAGLDLAELAFLTGLARTPNHYGTHADKALVRRNGVLENMAHMGVITADQAEAAKQEPLKLWEQPPTPAQP